MKIYDNSTFKSIMEGMTSCPDHNHHPNVNLEPGGYSFSGICCDTLKNYVKKKSIDFVTGLSNAEINRFINENHIISPYRVRITLTSGKSIFGYFGEADEDLYDRNLWNFTVISPTDAGIVTPLDGRLIWFMKAVPMLRFGHLGNENFTYYDQNIM